MQKSTVFLLVMALASTGVSAGLWMQLRAERALNAELSERLSVAAANRITPKPVASPAAEPPKVIAPVAATPAPAPASTATELAFPRSARVAQQQNWQARQRQLMSDPKYREAFREQERLRLATRRDNFIRLLGMSPEQADAVIGLSIDRQMGMQERSINVSSEEDALLLKERMEAQEREYQARLRDLLGAEKSAQLQTYMESRQSRMQVDRFRTQLTGGDMLRDDQVEPLIAALHSEQAQMQNELQAYGATFRTEGDALAGSRQFGERQVESMRDTHRRMHSAASGILSNSQLEKLDAMLKRDLERHEAQQRMSHIQSKLEHPGVTETPSQ